MNRPAIIALAVGVAAFFLRAWAVVAADPIRPFSDLLEYHWIALHILNESSFPEHALRLPLYPHFLATIYRIYGVDFAAVGLWQALLNASTCSLVAALMAQWSRPVCGWIAGLVLALYPSWIAYSSLLVSETVFAFLIWASVAAFLLSLRSTPFCPRSLLAGVACGVLLSGAILTRTPGLALLPGFALVLLYCRRHEGIRVWAKRMAVIGLAAMPAITFWLHRNASLFQQWAPLETRSGVNLLIGSYPGATGRLRMQDMEDLEKEYNRRGANDFERDRLAAAAAWRYIRRQPWRYLALGVAKMGYFWGLEVREPLYAYANGVWGDRAYGTIVAWWFLICAGFPLILFSAAIGLWLRKSTAASTLHGPFHELFSVCLGLLFFACIGHFITFAEGRFHLPWLPAIVIISVAVWAKYWRPPAAAIVVITILFLVVVFGAWVPQFFEAWRQLQLVLQSGGWRLDWIL